MSTQANSDELMKRGEFQSQNSNLLLPQSAQLVRSYSDLNNAERAGDVSASDLPLLQDDAAQNDVPRVSGDVPQSIPTQEIDGDEVNSVRQMWSPYYKWYWCAIISFLIQAGVLVFAAVLIYRPFLFPIYKSSNHFPIPVYNFIVTLAGSLLAAINLVVWTQVGAEYLVRRLGEDRINYRFYDRCVHWARGNIHFQSSFSFFVSLALFLIFKSYAAAFTAAFGVNPVTNSYTASTVLTNISANADALLTDVGVQLYNPTGNDFDLNLFQLHLLLSSNDTAVSTSPFLFIDGLKVQGTNGMVLGAEVGANAVATMGERPVDVDPKVAHLLFANYGTNVLHFAAAGVHAATRCTMTEQYVTSTSESYNNIYTIFNISTPSCGQISKVHATNLDTVYDVYACLDTLTIVTGIIRTNPYFGILVEAMECSTTLSDALGSGYYAELDNGFTLNPGTFEATPMIQNGVLEVFKFTYAGWIETIGLHGSAGLFAFINLMPLDDSTMTSKMEDAISYMYAIGGAKVVDNANVRTAYSGTASPFISSNTTMEIVAVLFQIGYGQKGAHKYLIVFIAINVVLALTSAFCMFWFPPMPLNPTEPLSMMLLGLNSPQAKLLIGTSVGQLPDISWRESLKTCSGWFANQCCGRRQARKEAESRVIYENIEFQLEVGDNEHLQLIPYGERGDWKHLWSEARPPRRQESYR